MGGEMVDRQRWWLFVCFIAAFGLVLRILCARGGLWLDEAVSAIQAHGAGSPLGVFLKINHDNNHHINSLWMQLVGLDAPPMLARALSIVTSTVAILIAGVIGARRAPLLGLLTAGFFAVSPMLVTLGSEARGYAPLTVAFLIAMLRIDQWLSDEDERSPGVGLALCFFLGAFCHLMMFFAFPALAGWVFFTLWQREGLRGAIVRSLRLFLPSIIALTLVAAIIWSAAAASANGIKFGGWEPFTWEMYAYGLTEMFGYTFGGPILHLGWLLLVPALLVLALSMRVLRLPFHCLAIVAFPLAIAFLQPANVGFARYYLLVALALLILGAEVAWRGLVAGGWRRWLAIASLAVFGAGSLACDIELMRNLRADPGAAIRALQARAPIGAKVIADRDPGRPQLITAAASAHYTLQILRGECPAARFLFVDRFYWETFPAQQRRCGRHYVPIAAARAKGLSGTHWTLYEVRP